MAEIKKMGYCVNGEWKESKAEKYMDVTDSSTGEVIAQVPCCTPDEVEEVQQDASAKRCTPSPSGPRATMLDVKNKEEARSM